MTFERKALRALAAQLSPHGEPHASQWIYFEDDNGPGFAPPDFFLVTPGEVLLAEVKLSQTAWAESQMARLYQPLLWKLFARPITMLAVFRNLYYSPAGEVDAPIAALGRPPGPWTWHFTR